MTASRVWAAAYERSAREGIAAPVAPALIEVEGDTATCVACGESFAATHERVQRHGFRCSVDPWPLVSAR